MCLDIGQEWKDFNGLLMVCNSGCSLSLKLETSIVPFLMERKSWYILFTILNSNSIKVNQWPYHIIYIYHSLKGLSDNDYFHSINKGTSSEKLK